MTTTRYPLAPLAAHLRIDLGEALHGGQQPGQEPTGLALLGEALGITRAAAESANRRGLSADQADEWALRAGIHPGLLWPEWWDFDEDDADDEDDLFDPPLEAVRQAPPSQVARLRSEYAQRLAATLGRAS